jgi:CelD/BcsL family acetyltransferase involved in cellulose biosynthesis
MDRPAEGAFPFEAGCSPPIVGTRDKGKGRGVIVIRTEELGHGPRASTWVKLEIVRDGAAFAALRSEWNALLAESTAGMFNSWAWLYPWYRRIAPDREPWILTARNEQGALVGVLPLALERRRVTGVQIRRLAFMGETHVGSDYLDVVAKKGLEEPVARAFAARLREESNAWDVLDLLDFDACSPTIKVLLEAFDQGGYDLRAQERFLCPHEIFTEGEPFDAFLKRTGRRDNYLRRRKWLEKQPGYQIEKTTEPGALARPMADFLRLHRMRWAGDGGSQGIKGPSVEAFHRDATQLLAEEGKLRFYTLRLGEQALASVYGMVDRGKFLYFQSGYDPEWRNKSVGLVLVGETFKDSIEAGLAEYDFLRGTESYKSDWTTKLRRTVALRVSRSTPAGRWLTRQEELAKRLRDLVKKALPQPLVEKVRRYRRKLAAI